MKKRTCYLLMLILLGSLLVACGPQELAQFSAPKTWIDKPLPGSLPLPGPNDPPYDVIAHAAFADGISMFEVAITSFSTETVPVPADQSGQTLVYMTHPWKPQAPGLYLIQVRAAGPDGTYGQMDEVQVQIGGVEESDEGDFTETPTPASVACIWTAGVSIFIREGPDINIFPPITSAEPGDMFPVVGQSQQGFHWALELSRGKIGYVTKSEEFGQTTGDCEVPTLTDPAPPPPTKAPTRIIPPTTTPSVTPIPPPS